jgi:PAS domain S-box-containing protein
MKNPVRKPEPSTKYPGEPLAPDQSLMDSLPNPIIIHVNGKVVFANEIILALSGHETEEIIGKDLEEILVDPVDPVNTNMLYRMFSDPDVTEEEVEFRSGNRKMILKTFLLRNARINYKGSDAVMSILFDITERKNLEKYVLGKVIETEEKERKRFATDLHDDLGPILSSIKIHLGMLTPDAEPLRFAEDLRICNVLLNEAIAKMRIISNNLAPRLIENYGIEAALNSLITMLQREGVFSVELISNLDGARFPPPVELHFYRIIGELLNNSVKHSGGSKATVNLSFSRNVLQLIYYDDGKGYEVKEIQKKPSGMGLGNIMQRVNLIDGEINFHMKKGKTEVRITREIDR